MCVCAAASKRQHGLALTLIFCRRLHAVQKICSVVDDHAREDACSLCGHDAVGDKTS